MCNASGKGKMKINRGLGLFWVSSAQISYLARNSIVLVYSLCQTAHEVVNIYLVLLLIVFLIGNYLGTMKDICK